MTAVRALKRIAPRAPIPSDGERAAEMPTIRLPQNHDPACLAREAADCCTSWDDEIRILVLIETGSDKDILKDAPVRYRRYAQKVLTVLGIFLENIMILHKLYFFRRDVWDATLKLARTFRRDHSGATAVETALVAFPFFAMLIAALQLGLVYLCQSALEAATEKTTRSVLTGAAQTAGMTQQQFLAALCGNLPSILSCSNVMVDAQVYASFANSNTSAPTMNFNSAGAVSNQWAYNLGGANSVVVIRVMYLLPVIGALSFNIANQPANRHLLMSVAVFKNEPYQ